ncbi:MAG: hypothetical protein CMO59_08580, partial [Verrucomicrobiales bacterium]|nr:hypothetical protein [Verrucomicrobiales bacterium]
WKDDKPIGLHLSWYKNGQKSAESNYKDGMEEITLWYKNGQKKLEENYMDGMEDGLQTRWHENGQKKLEQNFKEGEPVEGSAKFWNSEGEEVDSLEEAEVEYP